MGGEAMGGEEDEKEEEGDWQRHGLREGRRGARRVCVLRRQSRVIPASASILAIGTMWARREAARKGRGQGIYRIGRCVEWVMHFATCMCVNVDVAYAVDGAYAPVPGRVE